MNNELEPSFSRCTNKMKFCLRTVSLIFFLSPLYTAADQITVSGGISSANVVNGISESRDKPTVQVTSEWDFEHGIYTGMMLYAGETAPAPQLTQGYAAYLGYFKPLNESSAIELSVNHYGYRGKFQSTWDYSELNITYHHSKTLSLKNAYADDYYGRGYSSHFVTINWQPQMTNQSYALISAGHTFLKSNDYLPEFSNAMLGLGLKEQRWNFQISYQYSDKKAELIHGNDAAGSRLLLEIKYALY